MIELDPRTSALVLIDLQKGILGNALTPVTSQELLERGQALAECSPRRKGQPSCWSTSPSRAEQRRHAAPTGGPGIADPGVGRLPGRLERISPGLMRSKVTCRSPETTMGRVLRH